MLIARRARGAWQGAAVPRQRWPASSTARNTNHTLRRCSSLASRDGSPDDDTTAAAPAPELRVGVVGLGAIGTICFAKLAGVAIAQSKADTRAAIASPSTDKVDAVPRIAVDAFVKPRHFEKLFNSQSASPPFVALHGKVSKEADRLAVATDCANVRIRVLATDVHDGRTEEDDQEEEEEQPLDVVLMTVKAYDSASVIQSLQQQHAKLFKRDALFVLLQNGLPAFPAVSEKDESVHEEDTKVSWRFANGVTYIGGRVLSFANVLVSGFKAAKTCVALAPTDAAAANDGGQDEPAIRKMELLGHAMRAAGFQWEQLTADEMKAMQWRKLIVNAGINPIASILNAPNKSVGACEWSRAIVEAVVGEAFQVARSEQVALNCTQEELVSEVLAVAANTGTNLCSMVADLRNGSRTEIEAITGRIVTLGQMHNVPTPANALLLQLVKALEAQQTHFCHHPRSA
ncbi:hypothetical protein Gpo141_00009279 [Globisporangium polare]